MLANRGHRLLTLLSALSLLLCAATVVLWVRSDRDDISGRSGRGDFREWGNRARAVYAVRSADGRLRCVAVKLQPPPPPLPSDQERVLNCGLEPGRAILFMQGSLGPGVPEHVWERLGVWWLAADAEDTGDEWLRDAFPHVAAVTIVIIPHWLALATTASLGAPSVLAVWRLVRARGRVTAGLCTACGYDLRATPDRCPECGAVPARAA